MGKRYPLDMEQLHRAETETKAAIIEREQQRFAALARAGGYGSFPAEIRDFYLQRANVGRKNEQRN